MPQPPGTLTACTGLNEDVFTFTFILLLSFACNIVIVGDQKVSVHLMITIQNVTCYVHMSLSCLQTFIDTRVTLTQSVIPNSNYVIMIETV
jgi:hypothetical protein